MSALPGRTSTALVVVDVQNDVVVHAFRRDAVVANIAVLVERARAAGVAVVWVQHAEPGLEYGSDGWRIVPELVPAAGEPLVHKNYGDSFEDTTFEDVLRGLNIGRLVVVGAQTDACVRSTIHGAFTRGYDVTLVADAHTTGDLTQWGAPAPDQVIAHTNRYWSRQAAPGRIAGAIYTADVRFDAG
ncbi:cysteine hydrolase family protein [soil metagenome]